MIIIETVGRIADEQEIDPVTVKRTAKTCPETELPQLAQCLMRVYPFGVGAFLFGGCVGRSAAAWIGRKAAG